MTQPESLNRAAMGQPHSAGHPFRATTPKPVWPANERSQRVRYLLLTGMLACLPTAQADLGSGAINALGNKSGKAPQTVGNAASSSAAPIPKTSFGVTPVGQPGAFNQPSRPAASSGLGVDKTATANVNRLTISGITGDSGDVLYSGNRGMSHRASTIFKLIGQISDPASVAIQYADAGLELINKGACGPNCLSLEARAQNTTFCGYRNFMLARGGLTAGSRLFVSPYIVSAFQIHQQPGIIKLDIATSTGTSPNHVPLINDGDHLQGTVIYRTGANGGTIRMTSSHPNNVQITPQSFQIPDNQSNLNFNFTLTGSHNKSNCLTEPVTITASISDGVANGANAAQKVLIKLRE